MTKKGPVSAISPLAEFGYTACFTGGPERSETRTLKQQAEPSSLPDKFLAELSASAKTDAVQQLLAIFGDRLPAKDTESKKWKRDTRFRKQWQSQHKIGLL